MLMPTMIPQENRPLFSMLKFCFASGLGRSGFRARSLAWAGMLCAAAVLLLSIGTTRAGSIADLDRENGVADAKLGAPVEAFKNLEKVEDAGRWLTFKHPGENLVYKGFEVTGIKYNFFKGKLYSINVDVDGKRSTRGILKALEGAFGKDYTLQKSKPADADTEVETREWTGAKVYLLYKSAANGRGGQVTVLDRPVWDKMQEPREQRAAGYRKLMEGSFIGGDIQ
jgi:hypothetical protein